MDVGVSDAGRTHDPHLFGQCVFEFALQETGHDSHLDIHDVPLQTVGIPQGNPYPLPIDLRFQVVGNVSIIVGMVTETFQLIGMADWMLVGWQSQGFTKEVDERCLSRVTSSDNEDTID